MNAWTITDDFITKPSEDTYAVGRTWPVTGITAEDVLGHKDRQRFHLYDDDGEHYYSGWLVEDGEGEDDVWFVAYQWGEFYAGTADIQDAQHKSIIG